MEDSRDYFSSVRAAIAIMIIVVSNNLVMGFPGAAGQDTWIVILFGFVFSIPAAFTCARLVKLMPGKNIYEMAEQVFGAAGKYIISVIFGGYCIYLSSGTLYSLVHFLNLTSLFHTPFEIIALFLNLPCLYAARKGMETLNKVGLLIVAAAGEVILIFIMASIPNIRFDYLRPVLSRPAGELLGNSFVFLMLPLGEFTVTLALFEKFNKKSSSYKAYFFGILFSALYFLLIFVCVCGLIGPHAIENTYFPTFRAISILHIGNIIERGESLFSFVLMLASICKIAMLTSASSKSLSALTKEAHQTYIVPISLFIFALSVTLYESVADFGLNVKIYPYMVAAFQIGIPLALWAAAEIKYRKNKIIPQGQDQG
ncbi:MAG: endospore germination permease [Oscillospiraceae bacterium]|nr:endospore germination permease [Oscillospiraceae bacterium]